MWKWILRVMPILVWLVLVLIPTNVRAETHGGNYGIKRPAAETPGGAGLYGQSSACTPVRPGTAAATVSPGAGTPPPPLLATSPTVAGNTVGGITPQTGGSNSTQNSGVATAQGNPEPVPAPVEVAATKPPEPKIKPEPAKTKDDGKNKVAATKSGSQKDFKAVLMEKCLKCHGPNKGNTEFLKADGSLTGTTSKQAIVDAFNGKNEDMTANIAAMKFSPDDQAALKAWASAITFNLK